MKKINILLLILSVMLLSACNLFESLDDKDSSTSTKEFEINESMNSGDYAKVLVLINELISEVVEGSSNVKLVVEDPAKIKDYYTDPAVQTYVKYRAIEAEARLGNANVSLSDILSELSSSTSSGNMVSKSTSGSSDTKIKDLVSNLEGIKTEEFSLAVEKYLEALTTDSTAYETLRNLISVGGKKHDTDYLSGSIALALYPIHKLFSILDMYDVDKKIKTPILAPSWNEFNGDIGEDGKTGREKWNDNYEVLLNQLTVSITLFGNYIEKNGNEDFDLDKIEDDAEKIKLQIKEITDEPEYKALMDAVGIEVKE